MGIDYTVHVGPFLKCKQGAKVDGERTINACTKKSCKNHKSEIWDREKKFCELCGSAIGAVVVKMKQQRVDTDPCQEGINEKMIPYHLDVPELKGYDVWVSNTGDGGTSFSPKHDGEQYMEVTTGLIMDEIQEFQEKHKKPIAKLTELYGKENVEIKWGVIHEIN